MVVSSPLLAAHARPWADVAVVHRLRIVRRRKDVVVLPDRLLQPPADQTKVGGIVVYPIFVNWRSCVWRDDIETLRPAALRAREHLAVESELKDGPATRLARELGIGDLVCPITERAWRLNLQQNVWAAVPIPILERALNDGVGSCAHGIHRARNRLGSVLAGREIDEMTTGAFKRFDVLALVLKAAREEGFKDRIVEVRTGPFTVGFAKFQRRAVAAVQEVGKVRRRKNKLAEDVAHLG